MPVAIFAITASIVAATAAVIALWKPGVAVGVIIGGVWNLTSVWCLGRLLSTRVTPKPSRGKTIAWALVKFPLLYLLVGFLFMTRAVSLLGFGIGFTIVLLFAMGWFWLQASRTALVRPHGR